ncbi:MAG: efflux transporter periplasmic adaptor subunit [Acidobacteria bacterium]|nr:MAG: efflux transporter periplasmic adaptor subunit [Acidobacteriota bacterium]
MSAENEFKQVECDDEIVAVEQDARPQHSHIQVSPDLPPARPRKAFMMMSVVPLALVLAGGLTLLVRHSQARAVAIETEHNAVPSVVVVHPLAGKPDEELVLPGSLQAFKESPIYARTNGYLMHWYKDIGSQVKKGELLAQLDTPEIDQELKQARATRQQVFSQMELAKISSDRWEKLLKTDSVSAHEVDQFTSGYQQAKANLAAAEANVRRLEELESFKKVYAPFSGVLTRRNVDTGALINAGANGKELFDLAQVDTLRVFTSVPQAYMPQIKVGTKAVITLQEYPGEKFVGVVARTSESIDTVTRTLLTEVDVPNNNGRLLPGSFGMVHFAIDSSVPRLTVPVNALLFRAEGLRVAVVGPDGKVRLRALSVGRDYGTSLEVLSGLDANDRIVINPFDSLDEGQQVNIAQPSSGQQQNQPQAPAQKGNKS